MSSTTNKPVTFSTTQDFRTRLVLSTLCGRPIRITQIRSNDTDPGLKDYEVSFLRLLEAITNGSAIEISYTGTTVIYKPGIIVGGEHTHHCPLTRGIGYYIEPLLILGAFGKKELKITFKGITSSSKDLGVDTIRTAFFPVLEKFGYIDPQLKIVKRGAEPKGGGEAILTMRAIKQPNTLHATDTPQVVKIRGIAYSTRVSPDSVNRIVDAARTVLRPTGVDTHIYTDVARGNDCGLSPGFGVTIVAEAKNNFTVSAEGVGAAGVVPEDVGTRVAQQLLEEISKSGAVTKSQIPMTLIMMLLGKEDLGRLVIGKNSVDERLVRLLRYIKQLWNNEILLRQHSDTEIMCSVKGTGFISAAKRVD